MIKENKSRRDWIKNAALLTTGFCGLTLSGKAFVHPQDPLTLQGKKGMRALEEDVIRLFYNENPYGPPPKALEKLVEVAHRGNRYATYTQYNFEALREQIAREEGLSKEHVLLGHGSFQTIIWLAEHYIRQGGEIMVPSPTFDIVGMYARRVGANVRSVEVNEKMEMNLVEMEKALKPDTRLICLCNPNNPTGTLTKTAKLNDFCEVVTKKCPVFVDEAYLEYNDSVANWRDASMVHQIKAGKNVIISRTFSKIYAMAGLRVGYLLGPPDLIKSLSDRFTLGFPGNMPNTVSVAAAIGALEDKKFIEQSHQKNAAAKALFYTYLKDLKLEYVPSEANFVYFKVPNFPRFKKLMNEHKVLLAGGWPSKAHWARVSLGKAEEMEIFYKVLKQEDWR